MTVKFVDKKREEIRETTNTIMKQRIMTNVFAGLTSYFDASNSHEENFAEDFEIDMKK